MKVKVKVWEITNGSNKWYLLYDKKDDYQNGIYNTGYMLYPAVLTVHEAYEQKRIIYI